MHPCDIHTICYEWRENNRAAFIQDLFNVYIDKMDFKIFKEIYIQLEITAKESRDVHCLNEEYVSFCNEYARRLMNK